MKVNYVGKVGLGLGLSALVLSVSLVPAHADPASGTFGQLVGLGSDTTQDVVNGLATSIGGGILASYDASGSTTTVVTRAGGPAIPRANGSGAGRDLLRAAIGQVESATIPVLGAASVPVTTADVAGLVQFARSSSGAGSAADAEGVLAYVPFAVDAVTYAVAPGSAIPANLTKAQLTSIFKGEITQVAVAGDGTSRLLGEGGTAAEGETVVDITTFVPQAGSGTRSYWLGQMGITESDISAGTYPNLLATDLDGADVQEHKGAALVSGTAAQNRGTIVPFSIAQWVAQANAKSVDHRAGALVGGVDGQAATTGGGTAYALNPSFTAYTRDVYNIVPSVLADDPTSQIATTFVGTGSLVCRDTATITAYGFGLLTGGKCGDTSVRAYKASTSTTSLTIASKATVGSRLSATVDVTSFGNGGGTVRLVAGTDVLASTSVTAGSTRATVAWTPAAAGTRAVSAVFVPALAGVAASQSGTTSVVVAAAATVAPTPTQKPTTPAPTTAPVVAAPSSSTIVVPARATIGKKATVTVRVTSKASTAGRVTLTAGTTKLGTANVVAGRATFKVTPAAVTTRLTASFVPSDAAVTKASKAKAVTLRAAKAKASVSVKGAKSVQTTAGARFTVTVKASGVRPTGKVVVRSGKRTLATVTLPRSGKAVSVRLPRLKAGSHKITVSYVGSARVGAAKAKTFTLTSRR